MNWYTCDEKVHIIETFLRANIHKYFVKIQNMLSLSWLVGKDVADALGFSNSRKALADHVDDEDKGVTKCDTLGGAQELTIINKSGFYCLLTRNSWINIKTGGKKMQKILLDSLMIELTRKCNLHCAHCYRGNQQDKDINLSALDNLFDQVMYIGDLCLFGGEPLLNLSTIQYIFNKLVENNICIERIAITTNGTICSDDFVELMKSFHNYIRSWHPRDEDSIKDQSVVLQEFGLNSVTQERYYKSLQFYKGVMITCSVDRFHNNNWGKDFFEKCTKAFAGYGIVVNETMSGEITQREGNGKNVDGAIKLVEDSVPHIIAYLNPYHVFECKMCPDFRLKYAVIADQYGLPYIHCQLYLSVDGKLFDKSLANTDYVSENSALFISSLNQPCSVFEAIKAYNVGKRFCTQVEKPSMTSAQTEALVIRSCLIQIGLLQSQILCDSMNISEKDHEEIVSLRNHLLELIKSNPQMRMIDIVKNFKIDFTILQRLSPEPHKEKYFRCSHCKKNMIYDGKLIHCDEVAPGEHPKVCVNLLCGVE